MSTARTAAIDLAQPGAEAGAEASERRAGARCRIGLDGYNLALPRGTGVATYGRMLGRTLAAMGHPVDGLFGLTVPANASEALREVLFFGELERPPADAPRPTLRRMARRVFQSPLPRRAVQAPVHGVVLGRSDPDRLPPFDRIFSSGGLFTAAVRHFRRYRRFMTVQVDDPPAIMHWTYPLPIRLAGARNIYTVHDLAPLRLPHASTEDKAYHYRLVGQCLSRGDHVCTVSDASRRDILEVFPDTDPGKLSNTYQAVAPPADLVAIGPEALAGRLRALFGLEPQGYYLFFGAVEPKKNLGRLIEAYLASEVETPLVIVGAPGWRSEGELRLVEGAHGRGLPGLSRIRRLEYLPRPLLMLLVRGARAVLFPSLYEGFGLPVAEAMSLGVPVLTSTAAALPEVTGGAALLVNPYDVAAIGCGLTRLDGDGELRDALGRAGAEAARRYSIDAYADRLACMYDAVLATPRR